MQSAIATAADGLSTDGVFRLDSAALRSIHISLITGSDIDLSSFYVSQIENLPSQVTYRISQEVNGNGTLIGNFTCPAASHIDGGVVRFEASPGISAVGYAVLGPMSVGSQSPVGVFEFTRASCGLKIGSVRPQIAAVTSIVIEDGDQQSHRITGDVVISAGENTRLRVGDVEGVQTILLDSVDTAGFDDDCGCGDATLSPITSLAGVRPDAEGNISVTGNDCLGVDTSTAVLALSNPCNNPCCGCETASELTDNLEPLSNQVSQLHKYALDLKNKRDTFLDWVRKVVA